MDGHEIKSQIEKLHGDSFVWALRCSHQEYYMACEALQVVYLKILEGRAVFKGRSTFKTWLFSVIRNTILEMRRTKRLRARREENYVLEMQNGSSVAPDRDYRVFKFRQKIAKLPQRQQQVLELHFYHNMTLEEVAVVLEISVGSVRQHYDRGKRKLKILLLYKSEVGNE